MIVILDFGSQTTHLIARRIAKFGIKVKILSPLTPAGNILLLDPAGIILSGSPASVYDENAPRCDSAIFKINKPILGICYGSQLITHLLGGKVAEGKFKEYGPVLIKIKRESSLFSSLPTKIRAWMSHGDQIIRVPSGFRVLAQSETVPIVAIADLKGKIFGVQFHPEVAHTQEGDKILLNFCQKICGLPIKKRRIYLTKIINEIKEEIKDAKAICAVSGGIDSTTAAVLVAKAIGKNLIPVYIENGLMRLGTKEQVQKVFLKLFRIKLKVLKAQNLFLSHLRGVTNPEEKRKIIGRLYIRLFEKEAKRMKAQFLVQGTIYSDVIESKGTPYAAKIKSHHNVAGLPSSLGLKLIEPLRYFYKDEVKELAKKLGLPKEIIWQQPFPGPGQAIRIIGEVTKKRLKKQQQADQIILEELRKASYLQQVFQSFPIMTGIKSTAVKGDARFYGEVVALRIYQSEDIMTANWSRLPYSLLEKIATRIVNEVPGISRVVYDITTKPPATMEWE